MTLYRNHLIIAASAAVLALAAPGFAAPQKPKAAAHNSGGGAKSGAAKSNAAKSGPTQAKRSSAKSSVNSSHDSKRGNTNVAVKKSGGNTVNIDNSKDVKVSNSNRNSHNDRRYGAPPPGYRAGGYYSGGHYYYDDDDGLGFVGKVAIASTAALVVGAILTDKPDDCQESIHYGQPYLYCNCTWYQPTQTGSSTSYVVVNKP